MLGVLFSFLFCLPILIYLFRKDKKNNKDKVHLYGIYGFHGRAGAGKTIAMTEYLERMKRKYGSKIYICTNYFYKNQDFPFTTWKQLLVEYDRPVIFAWDELPNEFNSRDFKDFPMSLLTKLTQVRKGNGIQICYTAIQYDMVDKNFRRLTFNCRDCKTWLGRFTFYKDYDRIDYDDLSNQTSVDKKRHIKPRHYHWFIQSDKLRDSYDSYQTLQSAKSKEYMNREELSIISRSE